jgi:hypothetical protein
MWREAESWLSADLVRRASAAIQQIPVDRIPLFCASCAERFFEGYAAWLAEEAAIEEHDDLPPSAFIRKAIEVSWAAGPSGDAEHLLQQLLGIMPSDDAQPIFKTRLNDYFVEPWLVRLALSSVSAPDVTWGVNASAAALDFHFQMLQRRVEITGTGPAFEDDEFVREFERDAGAMGELAIEIEDAEKLHKQVPDQAAMRERSAAYGRRVLVEVQRLVSR